MLLGQALFAMGKYDEAAGATQAAMQMLPEDKWGIVISNYSQLYGNIQDYTDELKALETARDKQPDSPALHFLLGFHFGYLGYPKHAVRRVGPGPEWGPGGHGGPEGARGIRSPMARSAAAARRGGRGRQGIRETTVGTAAGRWRRASRRSPQRHDHPPGPHQRMRGLVRPASDRASCAVAAVRG